MSRTNWTFEKIQEIAKNYKTLEDFRVNNKNAYAAATRYNWDKILFKDLTKQLRQWDNDELFAEALKYKTKSDFKQFSPSAYVIAWKRNIIDDICSHMVVLKHHYTIEELINLCKNYKYLVDFRNDYPNQHSYCHIYNLWDLVFPHRELKGNLMQRLIYSYEFPDNHVYIGLTWNIEQRQAIRDVSENDAVTKYIKLTGLQPERKILTELVSEEESQKLEEFYLQKYVTEGWLILNVSKTGSLGMKMNLKWTEETIKEEMKKYSSRSAFYKNACGAYVAAKRLGKLEEFCNSMYKTLNVKWTIELVRAEALKYKSRSEFYRKSGNAYDKAFRAKWLDEVCSHMTSLRPNRVY